MQKAFCPECGTPVTIGDRFCIDCGAKLPPEIAHPATPAPTQPAEVAQDRGTAATPTEPDDISEVRESDLLPEAPAPAPRPEPRRPVTTGPRHPDPSLSYFEDEKPRGSGLCSDNSCPCPETSIPKGTGYLFIGSDIVAFRRRYPRLNDARKAKEAQLNQQLDSQGLGAAFMSYRIGPILVCEQGARLRQLDLDVAGADARYWWETGQVPLRPTPLVGGKQQAGSGDDTMGFALKPAQQQPSNCFIATAACGTDQAEDVVRLREFRERTLRRSEWGKAFILAYEFCSPPLARLIGRTTWARWLARKLVVHPCRRLTDCCLE